MSLIQKAFECVFFNRDFFHKGKTYKRSLISRAKNLYGVKVEELTFIEQNKEKSSKYAEMARKGHRVMWVIAGNDWLGVVVDGKFTATEQTTKLLNTRSKSNC